VREFLLEGFDEIFSVDGRFFRSVRRRGSGKGFHAA
jgi:hypothetical protein